MPGTDRTAHLITFARLPRQKDAKPCSRVTRAKQFTMPAQQQAPRETTYPNSGGLLTTDVTRAFSE